MCVASLLGLFVCATHSYSVPTDVARIETTTWHVLSPFLYASGWLSLFLLSVGQIYYYSWTQSTPSNFMFVGFGPLWLSMVVQFRHDWISQAVMPKCSPSVSLSAVSVVNEESVYNDLDETRTDGNDQDALLLSGLEMSPSD
jgi:hypothetical protein